MLCASICRDALALEGTNVHVHTAFLNTGYIPRGMLSVHNRQR